MPPRKKKAAITRLAPTESDHTTTPAPDISSMPPELLRRVLGSLGLTERCVLSPSACWKIRGKRICDTDHIDMYAFLKILTASGSCTALKGPPHKRDMRLLRRLTAASVCKLWHAIMSEPSCLWEQLELVVSGNDAPAAAVQRVGFVQRRLSALRSVTVREPVVSSALHACDACNAPRSVPPGCPNMARYSRGVL